MAIVACTAAVWGFGPRRARRRHPRRQCPQGLPKLALPPFDAALWTKLLVPSLLICIVGYVESISVALTLAAKRRQRVDPDQELIALGVADIGSAVSGGFPVTGALSRSVVNFEAGAQTPAAGAFTAVGVALATLFLTPLLFFLPKATLAAIIIVAVLSLVDLGALKRTWAYSARRLRGDGRHDPRDLAGRRRGGPDRRAWGCRSSCTSTPTSRPHVAVVGPDPGDHRTSATSTRHTVVTDPEILSLRVDESLYFPNARFIEELVNDAVAANPAIRHVILECPAVNTIDASALESLEAVNHRLKDGGITLHLSEVKGPVMDRLKRSHFLEELTGKVHLTHFDAVASIKPELAHERPPVGACAGRCAGSVPSGSSIGHRPHEDSRDHLPLRRRPKLRSGRGPTTPARRDCGSNGGNRAFAELFDRLEDGTGTVRRIVPIDPRDLGLLPHGAGSLQQRPFAAVLGCSDARVPIELIFNEGPNDLFVVRVAGNTLGDDVRGSLNYALDHLGESLKLIVVLGHSACGAVTAAVDVFLDPPSYLTLASKHCDTLAGRPPARRRRGIGQEDGRGVRPRGLAPPPLPRSADRSGRGVERRAVRARAAARDRQARCSRHLHRLRRLSARRAHGVGAAARIRRGCRSCRAARRCAGIRRVRRCGAALPAYRRPACTMSRFITAAPRERMAKRAWQRGSGTADRVGTRLKEQT